jgi:outer membrane receptor protein involved in Fe transport
VTCIGTGSHQVTTTQSQSGDLHSAAGQYNRRGSGTATLVPEESDTVTFGVVLTPAMLPGFNLSVDYFDIQIDNFIQPINPLNTMDSCYFGNDAAACARIQRNANGSLFIGDGFVDDPNANIGGLGTSGFDVNANYGFDLEDIGLPAYGSMNLSFVGTLLSELETDTGGIAVNSVFDCAGFYGNQCGVPNPEWRHRARATWITAWDVDLSATWRFYGESELAILGADGSLNNAGAAIDRYFDAYNYFDLAATWQVMDTVTLRAGVNNVLDSDPPLSPTSSNGNTYPQLYDSLGRFFFFGVTANF